MPLVPQQDVVVVMGPYNLARGGRAEDAAVVKLRAILEAYPPCRIVSLTAGAGLLHSYTLTAVIETV